MLAKKKSFGFRMLNFRTLHLGLPFFQMLPAPGAYGLHETKDVYVDTPAPTHDDSCEAMKLISLGVIERFIFFCSK
jgi:hypothetical protein